MKVLYDHQIFSNQVYGGVSRHFYEIMNHLSKCGEDFELSLRYSNNLYIKNSSFIKNKTFFEQVHFRGKYRLLNFINKPCSVKRLKKGDFDIFHPTYCDPYFLDYIGNKPFVLTIHDMIPELFPMMFSKDKTPEWKKLLASRAAKIIAVSESTKRDIIKFYGIDDQKIEVIYNGNSLNVGPDTEVSNLKLPEKYLLYIGDRHIYKNFIDFIIAVAPELTLNKNLNIICGGGKKFTQKETELFKRLNISNQVYHYPIVNDEIMAHLYKKAIAFISPSLYEGFGIPILEAFACGCPVIVSNSSSLPEVAGDAAAYFDPYDTVSMSETVRKVTNNEDLRKELKKKGFKRLKMFSWEKTAEQTKLVYRNCV
ncbi:MAG: Alpha-maltose-1-phosphate synthase [candidate division WS2 bacterium]|nr:Alpha-maltose-1-phosphate synthase [Bacillota bacterium]MBT9174843.1 Alpha-maltose-1-phosphate synthase [Candidatus Lithacetigena glycinireducens]